MLIFISHTNMICVQTLALVSE